MKVNFTDSFKFDIKQINNRVIITKFGVVKGAPISISYSLTDDDINSLITSVITSENYCESKLVSGLWEEDTNSYKTCLTVPKDFLVEEVDGTPKKAKCQAILFYYRTEGESVDKLAFTLIDLIKSKTRDLDLSLTKNLITVVFPQNITLTKIITESENEDINFLEGFGQSIGSNIFLENIASNQEITKHSYYKYIRTKSTDTYSNDFPYLDMYGKTVGSNTIYRTYSNLKIFCSGLTKLTNPSTRFGLSRNGGDVQIYGTAEYEEFKIVGKNITKLCSGVEPIDGIPGVNIDYLYGHDSYGHPTNLFSSIFSIDNTSHVINYSEQTGEFGSDGVFGLSLSFFDYKQDKIVTITSENVIKLSQKKREDEWYVLEDESRSKYYYEEHSEYGNVPLYLFSDTKDTVRTFTIRTRFAEPLRTTDSINVSFDEPLLSEFFDISYELKRSITDNVVNYVDIIVNMKTKQDNLDTIKWNPIINEESNLILVTLSAGDYQEVFYMVQKPKIEDTIRLVSTNTYEDVNVIRFDRNQFNSNSYYIVAKANPDVTEIDDRCFWKIIDYQETYNNVKINIQSTSGRIGYNLEGSDINLDPLVINIPDRIVSRTAEPIKFKDVVIARIRERDINENLLTTMNWRVMVDVAEISIPMSKQGQEIKIKTEFNNTETFGGIGLYNIKVYTNCKFICTTDSKDYGFTIRNSKIFISPDDSTAYTNSEDEYITIPIRLNDVRTGYVTEIDPINLVANNGEEERTLNISIKQLLPTDKIWKLKDNGETFNTNGYWKIFDTEEEVVNYLGYKPEMFTWMILRNDQVISPADPIFIIDSLAELGNYDGVYLKVPTEEDPSYTYSKFEEWWISKEYSEGSHVKCKVKDSFGNYLTKYYIATSKTSLSPLIDKDNWREVYPVAKILEDFDLTSSDWFTRLINAVNIYSKVYFTDYDSAKGCNGLTLIYTPTDNYTEELPDVMTVGYHSVFFKDNKYYILERDYNYVVVDSIEKLYTVLGLKNLTYITTTTAEEFNSVIKYSSILPVTNNIHSIFKIISRVFGNNLDEALNKINRTIDDVLPSVSKITELPTVSQMSPNRETKNQTFNLIYKFTDSDRYALYRSVGENATSMWVKKQNLSEIPEYINTDNDNIIPVDVDAMNAFGYGGYGDRYYPNPNKYKPGQILRVDLGNARIGPVYEYWYSLMGWKIFDDYNSLCTKLKGAVDWYYWEPIDSAKRVTIVLGLESDQDNLGLLYGDGRKDVVMALSSDPAKKPYKLNKVSYDSIGDESKALERFFTLLETKKYFPAEGIVRVGNDEGYKVYILDKETSEYGFLNFYENRYKLVSPATEEVIPVYSRKSHQIELNTETANSSNTEKFKVSSIIDGSSIKPTISENIKDISILSDQPTFYIKTTNTRTDNDGYLRHELILRSPSKNSETISSYLGDITITPYKNIQEGVLSLFDDIDSNGRESISYCIFKKPVKPNLQVLTTDGPIDSIYLNKEANSSIQLKILSNYPISISFLDNITPEFDYKLSIPTYSKKQFEYNLTITKNTENLLNTSINLGTIRFISRPLENGTVSNEYVKGTLSDLQDLISNNNVKITQLKEDFQTRPIDLQTSDLDFSTPVYYCKPVYKFIEDDNIPLGKKYYYTQAEIDATVGVSVVDVSINQSGTYSIQLNGANNINNLKFTGEERPYTLTWNREATNITYNDVSISNIKNCEVLTTDDETSTGIKLIAKNRYENYSPYSLNSDEYSKLTKKLAVSFDVAIKKIINKTSDNKDFYQPELVKYLGKDPNTIGDNTRLVLPVLTPNDGETLDTLNNYNLPTCYSKFIYGNNQVLEYPRALRAIGKLKDNRSGLLTAAISNNISINTNNTVPRFGQTAVQGNPANRLLSKQYYYNKTEYYTWRDGIPTISTNVGKKFIKVSNIEVLNNLPIDAADGTVFYYEDETSGNYVAYIATNVWKDAYTLVEIAKDLGVIEEDKTDFNGFVTFSDSVDRPSGDKITGLTNLDEPTIEQGDDGKYYIIKRGIDGNNYKIKVDDECYTIADNTYYISKYLQQPIERLLPTLTSSELQTLTKTDFITPILYRQIHFYENQNVTQYAWTPCYNDFSNVITADTYSYLQTDYPASKNYVGRVAKIFKPFDVTDTTQNGLLYRCNVKSWRWNRYTSIRTHENYANLRVLEYSRRITEFTDLPPATSVFENRFVVLSESIVGYEGRLINVTVYYVCEQSSWAWELLPHDLRYTLAGEQIKSTDLLPPNGTYKPDKKYLDKIILVRDSDNNEFGWYRCIKESGSGAVSYYTYGYCDVLFKKSINLTQNNITKGLISDIEVADEFKVYVNNTNTIHKYIDKNTTEFSCFLGLFDIQNRIGETNKSFINPRLISIEKLESTKYASTVNLTGGSIGGGNNLTITFDKNRTDFEITREYTFSYLDSSNGETLVHSITLVLHQDSDYGYVYSDLTKVVFAANGLCINGDNGSIEIDTNISKNVLEARVLNNENEDILDHDSSYFLQLNQRSVYDDDFKRYRVFLKLKENIHRKIYDGVNLRLIFGKRSNVDDSVSERCNLPAYQGYQALCLFSPNTFDYDNDKGDYNFTSLIGKHWRDKSISQIKNELNNINLNFPKDTITETQRQSTLQSNNCRDGYYEITDESGVVKKYSYITTDYIEGGDSLGNIINPIIVTPNQNNYSNFGRRAAFHIALVYREYNAEGVLDDIEQTADVVSNLISLDSVWGKTNDLENPIDSVFSVMDTRLIVDDNDFRNLLPFIENQYITTVPNAIVDFNITMNITVNYLNAQSNWSSNYKKLTSIFKVYLRKSDVYNSNKKNLSEDSE